MAHTVVVVVICSDKVKHLRIIVTSVEIGLFLTDQIKVADFMYMYNFSQNKWLHI